MSQHIEIEFKNLLTYEEFNELKQYFHIKNTDFIHQVNHYFDTSRFDLKENGAALRIREKSGSYELTLKQPAAEGLLETNQAIEETEADKMLSTGEIPEGIIKTVLKEISINLSGLQYLGALTTARAELEYKGGLLVLDHSSYLNTEDFELEYEVTDLKQGQVTFSELLNERNIPLRAAENKIKRFFNVKYTQTNFNFMGDSIL